MSQRTTLRTKLFRGGALLLALLYTLMAAGCGGASAAATPAATDAITLSPATVTLSPGQTQTFTASFSGAAPATVDWTATGGTITGTGASGAFVAGSTPGTYTVTATAGSDPATATVTVVAAPATPPATSALAPASVTLTEGESQNFTVSYSGGSPTSVTWTATGGTISGSGDSASFVAGSAPGTYTVTAAASGAATATATVTVTAPPPTTATISPTSASLTEGQSQNFTASFGGTTPTTVNWSATGGTVAGSGNTGAFVAGNTPGTYSVSVAGTGEGTATATASITVTAPAPVTGTVAPATVSVTTGQTQNFTVSFSGTAPASVAWTATGGTITGSGDTAAFVAGSTAGTYTVTATGAGVAAATATVTIAAATTPSTTTTPLFTSSSASWLYSAATGTGINISSMLSGVTINVNTHDGGFDYPVQYTDGSLGCTNFTDTLIYAYTDNLCVPNVSGGYVPSVGGYGANDGHLVVVNTTTGQYYDFWKLTVDSSGTPTSTNVGAIVSGNLSTSNGTPGTTAAEITGLAGDIMPGELDCATCLQHALNVVVPGTMNSPQVGTQGPAAKTDGTVSGAIFREGAKIVFDPTVDVSSLGVSTAVQAIMTALQKYGGVITDQTGGDGISFYSDLPTQPDLTGIAQIAAHLFVYY